MIRPFPLTPIMRVAIFAIAFALLAFAMAFRIGASGGEKPVKRNYDKVRVGPAQDGLTNNEMEARSAGCVSCHTASDAKTMHTTEAVVLGCVDCHGGNASPDATLTNTALGPNDPEYVTIRDKAHVLPKYPKSWHFPSSANPKRSYTLLNKESPEFIRFMNPSDYRVAREACGACHLEIIEAAERSLMATGAMLWGGAGYNNGIVPFKNYVVGEAYTRDGEPACIISPSETRIAPKEGENSLPCKVTPVLSEAELKRGALPVLYPLPNWTTIQPGDVFRVFERGGRNINTQFAEVGLPNPLGNIQRLEEPGRPDLKQSNRGPGTGIRVAIPVLNIHKTRLNDPFMWFQGTNDQPGDYRNSGCAGCHVVYANDREPRHSLTWAQYGRDGQTATVDPTIKGLLEGARPEEDHKGEEGYIIKQLKKKHAKDAAKHGKHEAGGHGAPFSEGDEAATGGHGGGHGTGHNDKEVKKEKGHPVQHAFTRAIPTAQCMNCHMHQPNIFLNSYLGYTMWDYESDAPFMWPGPENTSLRPEGMSDEEFKKFYKEQRYPTAAEVREANERNPEAAAARGLWADLDFLRNVYDQNHLLKDTQFADYHGHGWNFRAILKRDRDGNLLDANGDMASNSTETENIVSPDDPEKFRKAGEGKFVDAGVNPGKSVHMMDIHAEKGLQCADCHFAQDSHGNGLIYGEVANAVEIGCKDCHGTADDYPTLLTSNLAARPQGTNLALLRNADGQRRFEWFYDGEGNRVLIQRSIVDPKLEWRVKLVKDSVDRGHPDFNPKSARAKLMGATGDGSSYGWGPGVSKDNRAHKDEEMTCFTCHLSWSTSCGGCHLPIEANWKTSGHKYEGDSSRNFATYNPQVARDEMFQLGRHQTSKGNIIAPIRSTSALVLSSSNVNRERIYIQQPPISAAGFSSQAFAPHFPHTVRTTETKNCTDCHLSENDDNNAVMAQTMLLGTNFVNFMGLHAWTGLAKGFEAVRVTEWDEPQAVIGSYLHRYAYPDYYKMHVEKNGRELKEWTRGEFFDKNFSGETKQAELFRNVVQGTSDAVGCLQLRGEYMYVAQGKGGFQAYDVASIGNKGFSEPIVTAPFSKLGHDTKVDTTDATCVALPTNQNISVKRNDNMAKMKATGPDGKETNLRDANGEQAFHDIYRYAVITDSVEGLILVNVDTLADGEFRNNFFKRALTWNPDNALAGARHVTLAGSMAYITTKTGLAVVDLTTPLEPKLTATIPLNDARASAIQFRYLWVTDAEGVKLFNVSDLRNPVAAPAGNIPLANARKIYLARTYLYIAAKQDGLVIANVTKPEAPNIYMQTNFDGQLTDAEDVVVATTNASLIGYVADGRNGMKVLQLTSPESQPNFYGFSPAPKPQIIAWVRTPSPALSLSKGLDRDRGVDETGGQMAIFGRVGSRPFQRPEMERFFLIQDGPRKGQPYKVRDSLSGPAGKADMARIMEDYIAQRNASR